MFDLRRFTRKLATFSVAALFVATAIGAATTESTEAVRKHYTWEYLEGYDPCTAAVAGLVSTRVLWFNDQVLVDNFALGGKYVYVTEAGAPDPRAFTLAYSTHWEFEDPEGNRWNVTEWQYFGPVGASTAGTNAHVDELDAGTGSAKARAREHVRAGPYYTWTVAISEMPNTFDVTHFLYETPDEAVHDKYNFVVLVNTCKFLRAERDVRVDDAHTGEDAPLCDPAYSKTNQCKHGHERYLADILVGNAPDGRGIFVPVGQPGADYRQNGGNSGSTYPITP